MWQDCGFSLGTQDSSTNKADFHIYLWNIVESDMKHPHSQH
jgi:hypothetical protein